MKPLPSESVVVTLASACVGIATALMATACAPQQTHIMTEIHRPDGTVERYTNMSSGFGYNPNATSNINVGGVQGTSSPPTIVEPADFTPWYPPMPGLTPWSAPWGCGGFTYATTPPCMAGAAPIPVNLDVYRWSPGLR